MVLRTFLRARRQRVPPTEAMASAAAEPSLGQRALLGVGRVQWGRREGAVSEGQAGSNDVTAHATRLQRSPH